MLSHGPDNRKLQLMFCNPEMPDSSGKVVRNEVGGVILGHQRRGIECWVMDFGFHPVGYWNPLKNVQ